MRKIFYSNRVKELIPKKVNKNNEDIFLLSLLEHAILDKGFKIEVKTIELSNCLECGEIVDAIDEMLEELIKDVNIESRAIILSQTSNNFVIEFY